MGSGVGAPQLALPLPLLPPLHSGAPGWRCEGRGGDAGPYLTPCLPTPCSAAELESGHKKRLTLSEAMRNDERLAALPPEQVQLHVGVGQEGTLDVIGDVGGVGGTKRYLQGGAAFKRCASVSQLSNVGLRCPCTSHRCCRSFRRKARHLTPGHWNSLWHTRTNSA